MVRLTLELILQAPQYINPNKEWTLSLRGCKIPLVENLGATQDHFDCVDLTDNELLKLNNIPPLPRLSSLILCNNRISRIDAEAIESMPNLSSLILTNNRLDLLTDLFPIFKAKKLERLSLVGNGVCERAYYRLFVIFHLPTLRFLDFKHVTQKEKQQAANTFSREAGARLIKEIAPPRKHSTRSAAAADEQKKDDVDSTQQQQQKTSSPPASAEHIEKIKLAIARASTMEEIARLEHALRVGKINEVVSGAAEKKGEEEQQQDDTNAAAAADEGDTGKEKDS